MTVCFGTAIVKSYYRLINFKHMKNLILLFSLFIGSMSFAQGKGDVTIYSNTGNKFYVILNGVRQNDQPETNVKVTGLTNPWYDCKIMSANNNFTIEKKIVVKYDTLITYNIKEKRGKFKMRFLSEAPLGTSTAVPDQTVVGYHATEEPANTRNESDNSNTNTNTKVNNNNTTETVTTTTSSTTSTSDSRNGTTGNDETESVNINMNVTENGMGADVNVSMTGTADPDRTNTNVSSDVNSSTTTTSTTTTTTSTTTTSGTNTGTTKFGEMTTTTMTTDPGYKNQTNTEDRTMYQDDEMTVEINNNCYITDDEVDNLAMQVADESFADDQSRIGNMAAENKCMNTEQIMKVANSFSFEDNKLEFLKKAHKNCTDQGNYYKVMETLTFSGDKEELQNYINSTK